MPQYNPYYQDPSTQMNDGDKISKGLGSVTGAASAINPVLGLVVGGASMGYKGHAGLKKMMDSDPNKLVDSYKFNGDLSAAPEEFDYQMKDNPYKQSDVTKNRALGMLAWTPAAGLAGIKAAKKNRQKRKEFAAKQQEVYNQALNTHKYHVDRYQNVQRSEDLAMAQDDYMARRYQNAFNIPQFGQTLI